MDLNFRFILPIIALAILCLNKSFAQVSVSPDPVVISQPDNTQLTIVGKGSSLNPHTETIDGYTIIRNKKGYYVYAIRNTQGMLTTSKKIAHNPTERKKCEQRYIDRRLTPHLRREKDN